MMILNKNEEMMLLAKRRKLCIGLACALALLGLGVSTAWADLRFEAKGTEYDLTGKLVGDQLATQVAISPVVAILFGTIMPPISPAWESAR